MNRNEENVGLIHIIHQRIDCHFMSVCLCHKTKCAPLVFAGPMYTHWSLGPTTHITQKPFQKKNRLLSDTYAQKGKETKRKKKKNTILLTFLFCLCCHPSALFSDLLSFSINCFKFSVRNVLKIELQLHSN